MTALRAGTGGAVLAAGEGLAGEGAGGAALRAALIIAAAVLGAGSVAEQTGDEEGHLEDDLKELQVDAHWREVAVGAATAVHNGASGGRRVARGRAAAGAALFVVRPLTASAVLVPVLSVWTSTALGAICVQVPVTTAVIAIANTRRKEVPRARLRRVQRSTDEVRLAVSVLQTGTSVVVLTGGAKEGLQLGGTVGDALADVNGSHCRSGGAHGRGSAGGNRLSGRRRLLSSPEQRPSPSTALHP